MPYPKIAIIGGGPAGCTLALILIRSHIPCTVFESDGSANARGQGGSLDLHDDTGLKALKAAGLYDEFLKLARYDSQSLKVTNKHLRVLLEIGGSGSKATKSRPEIDRGQLRTMLVNALPDGAMRWNHKLRRVDDSHPSNLRLHFDNGVVADGFDLVVGADGAWSKVRAVLTNIKPFFAGMSMVRYSIPDVAKRHPDVDQLVNRGSVFSYGDSRSMTLQQVSDGSVNLNMWVSGPENYLDKLPFDIDDVDAGREHFLEVFGSWAPELKAALVAADGGPSWKTALHMLPIGTRWRHKAGVTVIGDAAHVMVPFAGEGVNTAMTDSVVLAEKIKAACIESTRRTTRLEAGFDRSALSKAVNEYEEEMFARGAAKSRTSFAMMTAMFYTTGGPDASIQDYVKEAIKPDLGWYLRPFVLPLIDFYYKWFNWRHPGKNKF